MFILIILGKLLFQRIHKMHCNRSGLAFRLDGLRFGQFKQNTTKPFIGKNKSDKAGKTSHLFEWAANEPRKSERYLQLSERHQYVQDRLGLRVLDSTLFIKR